MSRDRRDEEWERRADREYDRFTDRPVHTGLAWWVKLCIGLVVLALSAGLIFGCGSLIGAWGGEARKQAGPDFQRDQVTAVLDDEEGMVALTGNVCEIDQAGPQGSNPNDPQIVGGDPRFQYTSKYRALKADYDRRMENFFEASNIRHVPLPGELSKLPKRAPTLEEREHDLCPGAAGGSNSEGR